MKTLLNFLLFTFTFLLLTLSLFSQPGNTKRTWHWYFGDYAGLDFSSGQPVEDTLGQMTIYCGCATISDTAGNLQMYTDGIYKVWNKSHQVMENGDNFNVESYPGSPWQSSVIVPQPGSDNIYYIFYIQGEWGKSGLGGFYYAIVDMSYNSGDGKVITKGNLLFNTHSEAIGAVHHRNGKDVWIMGHEYGTNNFYAYLLTKYGITDTVITTIGNFAGTPCGPYGLRFSPNGRKMASSAFWDITDDSTLTEFDTLHLFDFNNQTGVLSNPILLHDTSIISYSFSPDNTKLYSYVLNYNNSLNGTPPFCFLYQYDISSNNQYDILTSKNIVLYAGWSVTKEFSDMQIGPDNKIYASRINNDTLGIINNPNSYGLTCGVNYAAIPLTRTCYTTLPNFISSYFNSDSTAYATNVEQIQEKQQYEVYPNPFNTETNINTANKTIEQYNLYDSKGSTMSKDFFQLKKTDNSYLFTNNKLKGGLYFLNGTFTNKEVFSIQLLIY